MSAYCDSCDRWFPHRAAAEQHWRMSSRHAWCESCDRFFGSDNALLSHYANSPFHNWCKFCRNDVGGDIDDHMEEDHAPCDGCNEVFDTSYGRHQHARQSHADRYCVDCQRMFMNANNYQAHRRSKLHAAFSFPCPSRQFGSTCDRMFVSKADSIQHIEYGGCSSGITKRQIDQWVVRNDTSHRLTNPNRMIGWDDSYSSSASSYNQSELATDRSYNYQTGLYDCPLCSRDFTNLRNLNQHLQSPRHTYADDNGKLYRCPAHECGREFRLLSSLVRHAEVDTCGVRRYLMGLNSSMRMLTI